MKARMFVVNEETLRIAAERGVASILVPDSVTTPEDVHHHHQWEKTVADLMADMLQIEIGDYLFFWEMKNGDRKSRIHGVYRAISKPYYYCDSEMDKAPFKIHIEKAYDFSEPIEEYDVLNCPYVKTPLWTIMGKKVANKPRGTSPLSMEEAKILIEMLIAKNPNYRFCPPGARNSDDDDKAIEINYIFGRANIKPERLNDFSPNSMSFFKREGNVSYEKVLEAVFNQELTNKNEVFFQQIGIDVSKVIWYSNYLPYSLEKSEMDYVIIESEDRFVPSKIIVVEFMKDKIDGDHIQRTLMYSKWVSDTLAYGATVVQPLLIAWKSERFNDARRVEVHNEGEQLIELIRKYESEYETKPLAIYTYNFSEDGVSFEKKK